ncbi:MAG: MarR family transcriptional regulator [Paracoccaceae bacterium]|nr:MarR family transcriptional regulator [Paracoccaceae bacterium]MDG2260252.1 MarR family transcriptional regulator [Paracoccaceae bacterium]
MTKDIENFDNLADRPGHLIRRLHQIHVAIFLEECSEQNLTPVQFGVLTVLESGAPRDQVTIARRIGVDRNTAADVIRRLEKRKLLERPGDPTDKRTKLAKITKSGKEMVEAVKPGMMRAQTRLIGALSNEEYAQYIQLTQKLLDANDQSSRVPWKPLPPENSDITQSDGIA